MNGKPILALLLLALVGLCGIFAPAQADQEVRLFDRQIARVYSGTTAIDVSAADYTSYQNCLTITPDDNHALQDVVVVLDLDFGDGANGFAGGYTSETIQFAVARKIQAKWRVDDEFETATVAGSNAGDRSVTLNLGIVGPTEDARIYVRLSAEQTDVTLPFVVYYRSGASANFTTVSN